MESRNPEAGGHRNTALPDKGTAKVSFLIQDAELRGIDVKSVKQGISAGNYEILMDLVESSDHVIGLL